MQTSTTREFKINNFDLLRLFAAIEVLLLHSYPRLKLPYPAFFNVLSNFPGVCMFFVMSGFLISASLERNPNLFVYFKNRAFRIFPALWVCLVLSVIVIAIVGHINFFHLSALAWFITQCAGVIYTASFLKPFGFGAYNGSLWTIPLELQFYIVLPMIYALTYKIAKTELQTRLVLIGVFVLFCIFTYSFGANYSLVEDFAESSLHKLTRYSFLPNIYLFLFGVLLQRFKIYKHNFIYGKGLFWLAGYLIVSYLVPTVNNTYMIKLLLLGVTTISLAYTAPTLAHKLLKGNDISYGVYIYHGLILGVVVELKLFNNPWYVLVILVCAIILATLSWLLIERPVMRSKKRTKPAAVSSFQIA